MAKRKRKTPELVRVDPSAISLRSMAVGWCTVLLDARRLPSLRKAGFNPLQVAARGEPRKDFSALRREAGRGQWMAVRSHPEITDADGVPGLDLVFRKPKRKSANPRPPVGPAGDTWFDPVSQYLNLPSGELLVIYEPQIFDPDSGEAAAAYRISGEQDQDLGIRSYRDACSYVIPCAPGFYKAHAFSRDIDLLDDTDGRAAELAIYLTPMTPPNSFRMAEAVLPLHPPDQDLNAMRRRARGLPPDTPPAKPRWLKNGDYVAELKSTLGGQLLVLPKNHYSRLELEPGVLVTLEVDDQQLTGVIIQNATPDPTSWELIEKLKRKAKNFATLRYLDGYLAIDVIKQARQQPFQLQDGISYTGVLRTSKDSDGQVQRIATQQKARGHKNTVEVPARIGKPGPAVAELTDWIEKTFSWTQACLFEVNGKTWIGAVYASPPDSGTNVHGKPYSIKSEIRASVTPVKDGKPGRETGRSFREWPEGIGEALQWVAQQAAGGLIWTKRYELEPDFWGKRRAFKKKDAQAVAIAAWQEILGLN